MYKIKITNPPCVLCVDAGAAITAYVHKVFVKNEQSRFSVTFKKIPAAKVNVSGKKATRIRFRSINYILKVKHFNAGSSFLCICMSIFDLFFTAKVEFNINHVFSDQSLC